MKKVIKKPRNHKRIGWQEICPTCVKHDYPDHPPDCEHCKKNGITEGVLCALNRMDQEDDPEDFNCDACQPKQSVQ